MLKGEAAKAFAGFVKNNEKSSNPSSTIEIKEKKLCRIFFINFYLTLKTC